MKVFDSFKKNPWLYYAISICATWAGVGSLIVGTSIAKNAGLFPWLLWALGNTLTCIVFGVLALKFPNLRKVAKSKPIQWLMGFMCIFQIWVNMNGIYEALNGAVVSSTVASIIVYAISIFFVILYLKDATPRNVMTDNAGWYLVYVLLLGIIIYSFIKNGATPIPLLSDPSELKAKGWLMITLAFGGFFYPTFWELLDYNDSNENGVEKIDMKKPFIMGGLLFGFYLLFVLLGANTDYSPAVALIKGILISIIAISSLSSFLYGSMINLGKKVGVAVDVLAIGLWQLLVPMGVMGVWTLMQNVRIWMVFGMFIIALIITFRDGKNRH